jgi:hypothetical protein
MDELGEFLVQILRWSKAGAIIGALAVILVIIGHFTGSADTTAASAAPQTAETESAPKPTPAVPLAPAEDVNEARKHEIASEQAAAAAATQAQDQPPVSNANWQPAPAPPAAPPAVSGSFGVSIQACTDAPVHPKHHWPRRFFGAIGHGFKAIGHGFKKVGKAIVGR